MDVLEAASESSGALSAVAGMSIRPYCNGRTSLTLEQL